MTIELETTPDKQASLGASGTMRSTVAQARTKRDLHNSRALRCPLEDDLRRDWLVWTDHRDT